MAPDLIVGVDLGTTYTGVSYCVPAPGNVTEAQVINRWPGRLGEASNKVPTVIACNYTNTTWGFEITQSQHDDGHIVIDDNFKLLLDQQILDEVNSEPKVSVTRENISKCFEIFLKNLYKWTNKQLEEEMHRELQGMNVEYHFSVPATWKEGTVADYLAIIKKAGFGSVDGHMATISLNEAEAAAVHTAIYNSSLETGGYKCGDIILVCDAGGGTTDVSIMEITTLQDTVPQFRQVCRIDALAVGSTNIDKAFNELVESRLSHLGCIVNNAALGEEFQAVKTHLGTSRVDLLDDFEIPIPGLAKNIKDDTARASKGCMIFSRHDIEGLFKKILPSIYRLIDDQLNLVHRDHPSAKINYFVLSGGLGSSKYVQQLFKQRYTKDGQYSNAEGVNILIANDPQLVVCRGLVLARIHQLYQVVPIVSQRCCRASYGIIQDELYDKKIHREIKYERVKSKVDGRYYLPGRIRWIIERDKPVDCGFSKFSFSRNVHGKDPGMLKHDIVRFDGEFRDRPKKFNGAADILVCKFRYNLEPALLRTNTENVRKQFKFRFIRLGEFWQVTYQIGFNVDSAGLGFDLWLGGEAKCSVGDIDVEWSKEVNTFVARDRLEVVSSIIGRGSEGD